MWYGRISITHLCPLDPSVFTKIIIILQNPQQCHHSVLSAERIHGILKLRLCSTSGLGKKVTNPLYMLMTFFDPGWVSSIVASVQGVERVKDPFRDCTHCWERGEWVEGKGEK